MMLRMRARQVRRAASCQVDSGGAAPCQRSEVTVLQLQSRRQYMCGNLQSRQHYIKFELSKWAKTAYLHDNLQCGASIHVW